MVPPDAQESDCAAEVGWIEKPELQSHDSCHGPPHFEGFSFPLGELGSRTSSRTPRPFQNQTLEGLRNKAGGWDGEGNWQLNHLPAHPTSHSSAGLFALPFWALRWRVAQSSAQNRFGLLHSAVCGTHKTNRGRAPLNNWVIGTKGSKP